jgi:5-methyltetrahydrofolate--homocysteine methyltransferase
VNQISKEFLIIGENVHTTRAITNKSPRLVENDGVQGLGFESVEGEKLFLPLSEEIKSSQEYRQKRIKHMKLAVQTGMSNSSDSHVAVQYVRKAVVDQENAGANFIDINIDEISVDPKDQAKAMDWLVGQVGEMTDLPLSIDSSLLELIRTGLEAASNNQKSNRVMLNSASLERSEALDLAVEFNAKVIVTAAGESAMPSGVNERVENASKMINSALEMGIDMGDIFVDPLVFPISVDSSYGKDSLEAITEIRKKFGDEIHVTGGMSNVSFGIPMRSVINTVFLALVIEAGADSGIIDPIMNPIDQVINVDRSSESYVLAENTLLGKDEFCGEYISAWREGRVVAF